MAVRVISPLGLANCSLWFEPDCWRVKTSVSSPTLMLTNSTSLVGFELYLTFLVGFVSDILDPFLYYLFLITTSGIQMLGAMGFWGFGVLGFWTTLS